MKYDFVEERLGEDMSMKEGAWLNELDDDSGAEIRLSRHAG